MNQIIHRSETRGGADLGWLKANYSFSFADYQNRERMNFGCMRVLNDDVILPEKGFGTHPHHDMEIVTVILEGALKHQDSMGNSYVLKAGEVQRMSAGTGITHSEFNARSDQNANVLQIWVFPEKKGIEPSYEQKVFASQERQNKIQTLVHPDRIHGSLGIHQNAIFSRVCLDSQSHVQYSLSSNQNGVYLFVIEGEVRVEKEELKKRDAIGISGIKQAEIQANQKSDVLLIEVPMELPGS